MVGARQRKSVVALSVCVGLAPAPAWAQAEASPSELAAARAMFAEALRDEEAHRFSYALTEFERVRQVRDTASIEYRIGTCHEGLGEVAPAYVAYRKAVALGRDDARSAEVTEAARARLNVLSKRIALLRLVLPENAPQDVEVRVDDALVARGALRSAIVVEAGPHVVSATTAGATPSRFQVLLPPEAEVSLPIALAPRMPALPKVVGAGPTSSSAPPERTRPASPANRGLAWALVGGGGALLAGGGVLLFLRSAEIAKLNRDCPEGKCPPGSDRTDLESTRSRAAFEGPAAAAFCASGLVSVAVGVYLVATGRPGSTQGAGTRPHVAVLAVGGGGGIAVEGDF